MGQVLLGRFRAIKKIGEGSLGVIYLGEHVGIGKKVAIEFLKLNASRSSEKIRTRFRQEAGIIASIKHENVVQVSDFGEGPHGQPFLIMEHLEGENLAKWLCREGRQPWDRIKPMAIQICRALGVAHERGVVHRALKPENCYRITRNANADFVKVLDFGIAKIAKGDDGPNLTETGEVMGSAAYMAPEQAKGGVPDSRTDVYALGVILYELLVGVRPFVDDNPVVLLGKHVYEPPRPLREAAPDAGIPAAVEAIVLRALAKAPEARFQSMSELIAAIESVVLPAALRPDLSGQILLGRFQLIRRIGEGGMGDVYLARHTTIDKQLAVKVLRSEFVQTFRGRFLQEAKAASQIHHENVVQITDYGETATGQPFLVMERLDGETLRDTLQREGRLPWPRVKAIMTQICKGLQAAHDLGIVHRDIKPDNIFLTTKDEDADHVKILDFGIAKLGSEGSKVTGEVVGTAAYMSPEQAQGEKLLDFRVDIYAVGILMYEMLVGSRPFDGADDFSILYQHVHAEPIPPRQTVPELHEAVEAVVLRAMQKEPSARQTSMREMVNELNACMSSRSAFTRTGTLTQTTLTYKAVPSARPRPLQAAPKPARKFGLAWAVSLLGSAMVLITIAYLVQVRLAHEDEALQADVEPTFESQPTARIGMPVDDDEAPPPVEAPPSSETAAVETPVVEKSPPPKSAKSKPESQEADWIVASTPTKPAPPRPKKPATPRNLGKSEREKGARSVLGSVEKCFTIRDDSVTVEFDVQGRTGAVLSARVTSDTGKRTSKCVERAAKAATFGKFGAPSQSFKHTYYKR